MITLFIKSVRGWRNPLAYGRSDNVLRLVTVSVFDVQVIVGVYLYFFLSPVIKVAFDPQAHFMQDAQLRFYALEHIFVMVLALLILHGGNIFIKKADTPRKKFKRTAITLLTVLIIVLMSIPWPGLPYGRVLFRIL